MTYVAQAFEELYYGKSHKTGWKKITKPELRVKVHMTPNFRYVYFFAES